MSLNINTELLSKWYSVYDLCYSIQYCFRFCILYHNLKWLESRNSPWVRHGAGRRNIWKWILSSDRRTCIEDMTLPNLWCRRGDNNKVGDLTLEGPCIIFCNIYTFQRDTLCCSNDCLLMHRSQLYMFRTVTVNPQELLFRCCMCRLWYVVRTALSDTSRCPGRRIR